MDLPVFSSRLYKHGRLGQLSFGHAELYTPILFPVVCLITGTTARGGGLWKYILQADLLNGLLRRNLPVMSQVLHFLDFSSANPRVLEKWRRVGLRRRYNDEVSPPLHYTAPLFLDSGGFKLLWNDSVDLSAYGLSIKDKNGPKTILELQKDLGGDIVATLDYPLPPGLAQAEAEERMRKSLDNAVSAAMYLVESSDYRPFLFVAAHGQDRASMGRYVQLVFERFRENGLKGYSFGLAVGSLVPLRGAKRYSTIVEILLGLQENIPEDLLDTIPIHVFGITGNLVPILAYLGVDSFDSSTFVQEARSLGYIDPKTHRPRPVLEMEEWTCSCRVCRQVNLAELQDALTFSVRNRPLLNGLYKSKYYSDIALHNLEMDFQIVRETRQAIEADSLQEYLIQHAERFPELRSALDIIAKEDGGLRVRLTRTTVSIPQKKPNLGARAISLKYTSDSFNILLNSYHPPEDKRILLVLPCSGGKPYSASRSHRLITERLAQALGERATLVHKVTLSGLYGPVPEEKENEPAILGYDFRLEPANTAQINLITNRLIAYLERYGDHYEACLGYATSRAYRAALEQAARRISFFHVFPIKPKTRRLTEFFRRENVEELVKHILSALNGLG
jgi:7-cyano-7-deazaguanine tRNA-ribosyltransferase